MEDGELEQITKKEFDNVFKENISLVEKELIKTLNQMNIHIPGLSDLTDCYLALLEFRSDYRRDYKTHRVGHYINDSGLTYKKIADRKIGFQPHYNDDKTKS